MEKIYVSNSLKHLSLILAENFRKPAASLFQKTTLVTHSAGMNAWIKTELAQQNRVFANFKFLTQDGLFKELYHLLFNEPLVNDQDKIRFELYEALDQPDFIEKFPEVAQYYANNESRRIQLTEKIADLFDQYQLYRPEMIEKWDEDTLTIKETSTNKTVCRTEKWQQWLWKELEIESKSTVRKRILAQLENQKERIKEHFPEITVFGVTIFTKFHLSLIRELAKWTNVTFYLVLPNDKKEFKNDLSASYGAKAMELSQMMGDFDFMAQESKNDTLLGNLQNHILKDISAPLEKEDDSIQINSCYTPAREVECLYNYLLNLFAEDASLLPRDILVTATDINTYAPFIKAVFRNAPIKIPYRISGEVTINEDSIVAALQQLMTIEEEDLTSEKVISLLENKRIKKLFGIEDTANIRAVVNKANIRFGRENKREDETHYVSWKYGLQKILLGYAMLTEEDYFVDEDLSLYPFRDTEASQSYELLRLIEFVERLEVLIDAQKEMKSLSDWKTFLFSEGIEKMIYHDDFNKNDRAELTSIYRTLSYIDRLDSDVKVSFNVFLEELKRKLFVETTETQINTGNVTIAPANAVSGLPHKVICMLGVNNDIFPRRDRFLGFDLMAEDTLDGDRSKVEADKHLFLDTLLTAQEKFYLSYIGQNVKDNTDIPVSVVVDTLLEYIGNEQLLQKHPLHGFSSKYNAESEHFFTYLYDDAVDNVSDNGSRSESPGAREKKTDVSVYDFTKFFEHPIEWYFNNILGVYYEDSRDAQDALPESELFELDKLQEWFVKNDLMKVEIGKEGTYLQLGKKEGKLPLKNLGEYAFKDLKQEIAELKSKFYELIGTQTEESGFVKRSFHGLRIAGALTGIYNREYISYAFSDSLKYKIRANISAMLLLSENLIDSAKFLYLKKKDPPEINVESFIMSQSEAKETISQLVGYFKQGNIEPLLFTPNAASHVNKEKNEENIFMEDVEGNSYASMPPNLYVKQLYEEGYFDSFDIEDYSKNAFDKDVYESVIYEELKTIFRLLHLTDE